MWENIVTVGWNWFPFGAVRVLLWKGINFQFICPQLLAHHKAKAEFWQWQVRKWITEEVVKFLRKLFLGNLRIKFFKRNFNKINYFRVKFTLLGDYLLTMAIFRILKIENDILSFFLILPKRISFGCDILHGAAHIFCFWDFLS
jgi:hypothetical protein